MLQQQIDDFLGGITLADLLRGPQRTEPPPLVPLTAAH